MVLMTNVAATARYPEYRMACQGVKKVSNCGTFVCAQPSRKRPPMPQRMRRTMIQSNRTVLGGDSCDGTDVHGCLMVAICRSFLDVACLSLMDLPNASDDWGLQENYPMLGKSIPPVSIDWRRNHYNR